MVEVRDRMDDEKGSQPCGDLGRVDGWYSVLDVSNASELLRVWIAELDVDCL